MNMSFSEKSAWISLVIMIYIWGDYLFNLVGMHSSDIDMDSKKSAAIVMLNTAIIAVIMAEAVFHTVLAMAYPNKEDQEGDERDKQIEMSATKPAYAIMFTGVVVTIGHLLIVEQFPQMSDSSIQIPFIGVHILMFSALLAEIVRFVMMIKSYRSGV